MLIEIQFQNVDMIINDGSVICKETKVFIFAKFPKKNPRSFSNKFHFHKFKQVDDKESCLVQPLKCLILPPTNGRSYQIYPARGFSQIMSGQERVQSVLGDSNSQHPRGSLRLVRCSTPQHRIVRYTIKHSTCIWASQY